MAALTVSKAQDMALRITALYLIISGVVGTAWPLLNVGPSHPEFDAHSLAYQIGSYTREAAISITFFVSGLGLLKHQLWARKVALVALPIAFLYSGNAFAWGWAGGRPSGSVIVCSYAACLAWYGTWFWLLYRQQTVKQLTSLSNPTPKNGAV